ncbi:MAG: response regulator, partial [Actinomycetota bacterium]|nr:response regulator [Actinomycetota bacterium]
MGDRILVVDDDPDILQYVKMNLELEGFETETASNGVEALKVASENPPSLVLLDVMMPGMDGLTTLRHLRNDPPTASVPVVMLTARALAQDRVKGLDLGADDYITKPFAVEELVARVRTVIRRAQQMRDVSPLTGLPGNFRIAAELERRISERMPIAVVYGDLDNFKAFNDHYGFMRGDTVIKFTAKVMVEAAASFGGDDAFVGHVGGDDYIALIDPTYVDEYCSAIIQEFDDGILDFYDTVDAVQGYIE